MAPRFSVSKIIDKVALDELKKPVGRTPKKGLALTIEAILSYREDGSSRVFARKLRKEFSWTELRKSVVHAGINIPVKRTELLTYPKKPTEELVAWSALQIVYFKDDQNVDAVNCQVITGLGTSKTLLSDRSSFKLLNGQNNSFHMLASGLLIRTKGYSGLPYLAHAVEFTGTVRFLA